ncbi:MAG: autotransporter-associated beta strand protein [Pirellulaceae bacterium]|jgi:autotransporter-associated beta strand protein
MFLKRLRQLVRRKNRQRSLQALPQFETLEDRIVLSYAATVLADSPVAYWQLDESTGTNADDTSAGNMDGTYAGGFTLGTAAATPQLGTAATFDGSSGRVNTAVSLSGLQQYTIELWANPAAALGNRTGLVGQNDAFEFGFSNSTNIQMWNQGAGAIDVGYDTGANTGQWVHIVAVGTGTEQRIYIDGAIAGTRSHGALGGNGYGVSGELVNIGGDGIFDATGNWFKGAIDDVAIYSTALSGAQIQSHYDAAFSTDVEWDGGAGDSDWNNPVNWVGDNNIPDQADENAFFGDTGAGTVNMPTSQTVFGIQFANDTGSYTLNGPGVLTAEKIAQSGAASNEVATNIVFTSGDVANGGSGLLTISGDVDINSVDLNVSGGGNTTISGVVSGTELTVITTGLLSGSLAGDISLAANPGNAGFLLSPAAGLSSSSPPWAGNLTWVYTGQVFDADGIFSFGENIDDKVRISVDGVAALSSDAWNVPTSTANSANNSAAGAGTTDWGMGPNADGWHDIEIRMSNGGGGAGAVGGSGWSGTYGIGFSDAGTTSTDGSNYVPPIDPGDGTLFRSIDRSIGDASLIKTGDGTLTLSAANTYTGTTLSMGGTIAVANSDALGDNSAGTIIADNGDIQLVGGVATPAGETLTFTNVNSSNQVASLSNAGANSWGGEIYVEYDGAVIQSQVGTLDILNTVALVDSNLAFGGDATVNVIGNIGGATGDITKIGDGTTIFAGDNSFAGALIVEDGTLSAASVTALGATGGGTIIGDGGTISLNGVAISGEQLSSSDLNGSGQDSTLDGQGDSTWDGPINITSNNSTFSSTGGTLTVAGDTLMSGGDLTFDGSGDIDVSGVIIGSDYIPGLLAGSLTGDINLNANPGNAGVFSSPHAGLTDSSPPWAGNLTWVYTGQVFDADGIFSFGENIDDKVRISIDGTEALSNDTWNQPTTTGSASNNGAAGAGTVDWGMGPGGDGWHDIEIRMSNGGGGAGGVGGTGWSANFGIGFSASGSTSNDGSNYVAPVDPGDGSLFRTRATPGDVTQAGSGSTTLSAANSYFGDTVILNGTLVAANNDALGGISAGTTIGDGGTLGLSGGVTISTESLTVSNIGSTGLDGVISNIDGDNTVDVTVDLQADITFNSDAGTLTVNSDVNQINNAITVDGAGDVTLTGSITNSGVRTTGLIAGTLAGDINLAPNPSNQGIVLTPAAGNSSASPPWAGNLTWVYTGKFYDADGVFSFAENIDDKVRVSIDGTEVINNDAWNVPTTSGSSLNNTAAGAGTLDFNMGPDNDGWHDIEIRMSNGGGGAGAVAGTGWAADFGFGVNIDGSTSNDGSNYVIPVDPGDGSVFTNGPKIQVDSALEKNGAGTLTLSGDSDFAGGVNVNGGTLLVSNTAGSATGTGPVALASGTTFTGDGSVSGDVTAAAGSSIAPGNTVGSVSVNNASIAATANMAVELTSAGHDTLDVAGQLTLTDADLAATLEAGFRPTDGQVFVVANNATNATSGTFAGLADDATFELSNGSTNRYFSISYDYDADSSTEGGGDDIALIHMNRVPVISLANVPIAIDEGSGFDLDATGTTDADLDLLTFSWDLNNDGTFGDATGDSVSLTLADLLLIDPNFGDGPNTFPVALQVSDGEATVTQATTVTVNNVAPTATVAGSNSGVPNLPLDFTIAAINEPSPSDAAAGYTYTIDWMDGSGIETIGPGASNSIDLQHAFGEFGTFAVTVTAADKDGGTTSAILTVQIDPVAKIGDNVFVGGTDSVNDRIIIQSAGNDEVFVRYNNVRYGSFETSPTSIVEVFGGEGNDRITVAGCIETEVHLEGGNDYFAGGTCNDSVWGGEGRDMILLGEGNNWANGGGGNDTITGRSGSDWLYGDAGNDRLQGGGGQDFLFGDSGNDRLNGDAGADLLVGGIGNDIMAGGGGDDVLLGGLGNDLLRGNDGNDLLLGGAGEDRLQAHRGNDFLSGGEAANEDDAAAQLQILTNWSISHIHDHLGTLTDDGDRDALSGGGSADNFFSGVDDTLSDVRSNDTETTL